MRTVLALSLLSFGKAIKLSFFTEEQLEEMALQIKDDLSYGYKELQDTLAQLDMNHDSSYNDRELDEVAQIMQDNYSMDYRTMYEQLERLNDGYKRNDAVWLTDAISQSFANIKERGLDEYDLQDLLDDIFDGDGDPMDIMDVFD